MLTKADNTVLDFTERSSLVGRATKHGEDKTLRFIGLHNTKYHIKLKKLFSCFIYFVVKQTIQFNINGFKQSEWASLRCD